MSLPIPPTDTPAHRAMKDQGNVKYPGVDRWENPSQGIKAGTMLVQFDHREPDLIRREQGTASMYFTDAETLMRYMVGNKVNAQGLAEALQVGPYRPDPDTPHTYSKHVAIYALQRELKPEQVRIAQAADFGEGLTRNNLHWGDGVGKQYFVTVPRDQFLGTATPLLKLSGLLPCENIQHRLGWLQQVEQQPPATRQDKHVEEAVARAFEGRVVQLTKGTPPQQQHGREIKQLQAARRSFDMPLPKVIDDTGIKKLPAIKPADPAPNAKKHRKLRF